MAKPLPIDNRLEIAAQLVLRTRIFYDIWWFFDGKDTRPGILDAMNRYSEFFRFAPHAHFVAFIVHLAALLERDDGTINLRALNKELGDSDAISAQDTAELDALFGQLSPFESKVMILRNNLFAHRSNTLSFPDAFKKAKIVPNTLPGLFDTMLTIANRLLATRGLKTHAFNDLPAAHAKRLLAALSNEKDTGAADTRLDHPSRRKR